MPSGCNDIIRLHLSELSDDDNSSIGASSTDLDAKKSALTFAQKEFTTAFDSRLKKYQTAAKNAEKKFRKWESQVSTLNGQIAVIKSESDQIRENLRGEQNANNTLKQQVAQAQRDIKGLKNINQVLRITNQTIKEKSLCDMQTVNQEMGKCKRFNKLLQEEKAHLIHRQILLEAVKEHLTKELTKELTKPTKTFTDVGPILYGLVLLYAYYWLRK